MNSNHPSVIAELSPKANDPITENTNFSNINTTNSINLLISENTAVIESNAPIVDTNSELAEQTTDPVPQENCISTSNQEPSSGSLDSKQHTNKQNSYDNQIEINETAYDNIDEIMNAFIEADCIDGEAALMTEIINDIDPNFNTFSFLIEKVSVKQTVLIFHNIYCCIQNQEKYITPKLIAQFIRKNIRLKHKDYKKIKEFFLAFSSKYYREYTSRITE